MDNYLPAIVWLVAMFVCMWIARRRNVKQTFISNLLVVFLGPFAIPLMFLFKSEPRDQNLTRSLS